MTFKTVLATMLAAASMAFAPLALAQDPPEVPEIAAEDVTTGQVVSFVNAYIALERLRHDYQPKIEAAATEDERKALAEEADAAAKAAIEAVVGISPVEYLAIIRAAQQSEDLSARISTRMAELREKQQGRKTLRQQQPKAEGAEDAAE